MQIKISKIKTSKISEVDFDNLPFGKVFSDHMLVADYIDGQWINIEIIPFQKLSISPANSALHYGQSIFEGLKALRDDDGNPLLFRPEANWARLNKSAERMAMPSVPEELFIEGMKALIALDHDWIPTAKDSSLYIRPFMFASDEYVGIRPSDTYKFIIFTCPVGSYYSKPLSLRVATEYIRAFPGGVGFAKTSGNYAAALMPAREGHALGYDQRLWLDGVEKKYIEESGTMNLFFVLDNVLITPVCDGTILDGVTRNSVIKLAKNMGFSVEVRRISIDEVVAAYYNGTFQEAFGTGTAATLAYVEKIGYKDLIMDLPANSPNNIQSRIKTKLDSIKTGHEDDLFGWVKKVDIR